MCRTHGSVSLSSAEGEYYGMVSALAEAKKVQDIFGECHEDTHTSFSRRIRQQPKQTQSVLDVER